MQERLNAILDHSNRFRHDLSAKRQAAIFTGKRNRILKYLRSQNIELYFSVIETLGIQDTSAASVAPREPSSIDKKERSIIERARKVRRKAERLKKKEKAIARKKALERAK